MVLSHDKMAPRIAYVINEFQQPAIVEDFIDGREFHVSLWGNKTVEMLPPAEMDFSAFIDVQDRLCTFDAKYRPDSQAYEKICVRVPASLSETEYKELEQVAQRAYRVIGCRDYARFDIRMRDGVFYILDVNPNPDISSDTSMAFAAELAVNAVQGVDFGYAVFFCEFFHFIVCSEAKVSIGEYDFAVESFLSVF